MKLNRWLSGIVMLGLIIVLSPLGAQADPYPPHHQDYRRPHGKAYGWHGGKSHGYDRYQKQFRRSCVGGRTSPRPMSVKFTPDRRRSPISRPLLLLLAYSKSRNPNPFTPSPDLRASTGNSTFEPGKIAVIIGKGVKNGRGEVKAAAFASLPAYYFAGEVCGDGQSTTLALMLRYSLPQPRGTPGR